MLSLWQQELLQIKLLTSGTHSCILEFQLDLRATCLVTKTLYPVQYLQESDTFQIQLSDHMNIFGCEQVDNLYVLEGNQPLEESKKLLTPRKLFLSTSDITCPNY